MKPNALIVLLCLLASSMTTMAQGFGYDLVAKRTNLVYRLRSLGPLAPDSWINAGANYAVNGESAQVDAAFHPMGTFGFTGMSGNDRVYSYYSSGQWFFMDPNKVTAGLRWDHFGLRYYRIGTEFPWTHYHSMAQESYSVAGLRYQELRSWFSPYAALFITPGVTFYTGPPPDSADLNDLMQQVEIPTFSVSDYWFGPNLATTYNFPVDAKLTTPQATLSQKNGAFLIAPLNQYTTNIAWAQEGVYRPGLTLQPSYSTPRLYTYMQTYFDRAWRPDPITGDVPRLATTNWNGLGRINTNTATPAGYMPDWASYFGYYFYATNYGKVILTTKPQESGHYGELPAYTLGLLVDKNRDGFLDSKDSTSATNAHVFWVNNDVDRRHYSVLNAWEEDDFPVTALETNDGNFIKLVGQVPAIRDLEDYDRIQVPGLRELCRDATNTITVTFRWKQVLSGSPSIFLLQSADQSGSTAYLTDEAAAALQITNSTFTINGTAVSFNRWLVGEVNPSKTAVIHDSTHRWTNSFFLYCGLQRGSGELALTISRNGQTIGEVSCFLDIRDVKELYERWTVENGIGNAPLTNAVLFGAGLPSGISATQFTGPTNPPQPYVLFVHGWNMSPADKDAFSETAFKRLYWQGYTNRFGSFYWPTEYDPADLDLLDPFKPFQHYDRSELAAWRSAEGLRRFLVSLNQRHPGKVYMMAHSMGNVVAGEALALNAEKYSGGQIVNTYVASQAAVPMACYSATNSNPAFQLQFSYVHPWADLMASQVLPAQWQVLQQAFTPTEFDSGTAHVYPGWLTTNRVSCEARINFYNPFDFATRPEAWGMNQLLKPDYAITKSYTYVEAPKRSLPRLGGGAASVPSHLTPSLARRGLMPPLFRQVPGYFTVSEGLWPFTVVNVLDWEYFQSDMYEVMAFASESRTVSVGTSFDPNTLEGRVDLRAVWGTDMDTASIFGQFGRHKWHSAQFRSTNMRQTTYWSVLLGLRGFQITSTP